MATAEADPADPKALTVGGIRWRLWQSDDGTLYATRGCITKAEEEAGCKATIDAATPEERVERIIAQSSIPHFGG